MILLVIVALAVGAASVVTAMVLVHLTNVADANERAALIRKIDAWDQTLRQMKKP